MTPSNEVKYCKRCYANLDQAIALRCARCNREFDPSDARSFLTRPFPPRKRIIAHTVVMLLLATAVSFVISLFVGAAQLKYLHSGH